MSVVRPREGACLGRIAAHAHVLLVGNPPAMQRVFLHRGDEEAPVRRKAHVEMRAFPVEDIRRCRGVREPQRRAIIMRDREAIAFRRKARPRTEEGAVKLLTLTLRIAGANLLAGRPGERAIIAPGERVDPFASFMDDFFCRAIGGDRHDAAVIAAGEQSSAGPRRDEDRAVLMQRDARLAVGIEPQHRAVAERQRRDAAQERRRP